jgi:hypothetical protein
MPTAGCGREKGGVAGKDFLEVDKGRKDANGLSSSITTYVKVMLHAR